MIDLTNVRILLSNDDGINAPGMKTLEKIARAITDDVWIVAPETEQSAMGHAITMRRPLRIRKVSDKKYAVDGTPTDAVALALNEIMVDEKPALVLSGVNRGGNLGDDITYSGTVAVAMESTLLGVPAIAFSQEFDDRSRVHWGTAEHFGPEIVRDLVARDWDDGILMNVNFPDVLSGSVTGIEYTWQGRRKIGDNIVKGTDPRGEEYYWIAGMREPQSFPAGTDLEAVGRGAISITPVNLNFTHYPTLDTLRGT